MKPPVFGNNNNVGRRRGGEYVSSVISGLGVNVLTAFPDKRKVLDLPKLVKNMGNAVRVALRDLGQFGPPE